LPPQRKAARSERAAVGGATSLVLSGPFNTLDEELTLRIFALLDMRERLRCVSEARASPASRLPPAG
jgi:hypothetical protein